MRRRRRVGDPIRRNGEVHRNGSGDTIGHGPEAMLLDIYRRGIRIEGQNERIIADQARAADSRREIYTRLTELTVDQAKATSTLARISPLVDAAEVRRHELGGIWKLTALGGRHIGKILLGAALALGVWLLEQAHGLGDWLVKLFK